MKPETMTPLQTLLLVWAAGAVLTRDGDGLHVEAPKSAIPPPLLDALRANKTELLAILPARTAMQSDKERML
jgi:hypothetical protein